MEVGWCAQLWAEGGRRAGGLDMEELGMDGSSGFRTFEAKTCNLGSVSLSLHLIPACVPTCLYAFVHQKIRVFGLCQRLGVTGRHKIGVFLLLSELWVPISLRQVILLLESSPAPGVMEAELELPGAEGAHP